MKVTPVYLLLLISISTGCGLGMIESPAPLGRSREASYIQGKHIFYSLLAKAASEANELADDDRSRLGAAEINFPGLYEQLMNFYPFVVRGDEADERASEQAMSALAIRLAWEFARSISRQSPASGLSPLEAVVVSTGLTSRKSSPHYRRFVRPMARPVKGRWGWTEIPFKQAQALSRGRGIRVAIIDTGLDPGIKEIKRQVAGYKDFLAGDRPSWGRQRFPYDWSGHGTGVASVISQAAPEAELLIVKAFDEESQSAVPGNWWTAGLMEAGIAWAIEHGADVINLSAAVMFDARRLENLVRRCWDRNIILVASMGYVVRPGGSPSSFFPAAYRWTLAVGGVDKRDDALRAWDYSAEGDYVDVAAPSVSVWVERPIYLDKRLGAQRAYGNSLATAMVSGTAALVLASLDGERLRSLKSRPGALFEEVRDILCLTASNKPLGTDGFNARSGYGLINPLEAVRRARDGNRR